MFRKRLRFSLRSFFIVFTFGTLFAGYFVSRVLEQRRSVASIEQLGGMVFYDYAYQFDEVEKGFLGTLNATPPESFVGDILGPDFRHTVVGVWAYRYVPIRLSSPIIQSFAPVASHGELSEHTDKNLRCIRGLRSLQFLDLSNSSVTHEGLAQLPSFRKLTKLNLDNTRITDEGLVHVAAIPSLKSVRLWETKVTEIGIRTLQTARPKLEVWHQNTTEARNGRLVLLDRALADDKK